MGEEQYVVLYLELGVLAIGTKRAYGMDIRHFAEGIEFAQTALEPDEYVVFGYFEPTDDAFIAD